MSDRIRTIADQLRAERLAAIEADPKYAGAEHDQSAALHKQQAIQRMEAEIGNAVDLAIRWGW